MVVQGEPPADVVFGHRDEYAWERDPMGNPEMPDQLHPGFRRRDLQENGGLPEPMNPLDDPNADAAEEEVEEEYLANMQQRIRQNAIRRGIRAAQQVGILPRDPAWLGPAVAGVNAIGDYAGYPNVRDLTEYATPANVAVTSGAVSFFRWIYDQGVKQRNIAQQQKVLALAAKYPRVLGRTNFASPGNAQVCQNSSQCLPWRYL